ncbi:hypothetical protein RvY_01557 [Ramazzottius varieornatus]|uniref:Phospholipid scramblase n=1 Tax=Ramazzottius varieornatus TaxID=947166 RepID=A0A1D1UHL2_RAMVA|nr:hypothetical protein RvY_01557 [Ramazzottius varieornatus]
MNAAEQYVYFAMEVSSPLSKRCLGSARPFTMIILDRNQQEIMHIKRPLRCRNCCCFCCLQRIEVQVPPGNPIGYIEQEVTFMTPRFRVYNEARQAVLKVEGPVCTAACFRDVDYYVTENLNLNPVVTVNERGPQVELVGKLSKTWMGILHEATTDADHYALNFKPDLDVTTKASLLGISFLIDFMFYDT